MKNFRVDGIILKRQNVGEADRIVTIFTKEFGKLKVKASGVRKIASKRASHIEIFNLVTLSLYKTQGLPFLTEVITLSQFDGIKDHLARITCAYHVCELIEGLCPENQALPEVFDLLVRMLTNISVKTKFEEIVKLFEIELLSLLGYYSLAEDTATKNVSFMIENILERKLKTRAILPQLFATQR